MLKIAGLEIHRIAEEMGEEEFFQFCQANRELRIERDADQTIRIMTPVGGESGYYESELNFALKQWNRATGSGLVFSSSTGFRLPNGAVRSPDACWVAREHWQELTEHQKKRFPPLTPDFVAEIRSENDNRESLEAKMREYLDQGARLGLLFDPQQKEVLIYRRDGDVHSLAGWTQVLVGDPVLPGFRFDLAELRMPD